MMLSGNERKVQIRAALSTSQKPISASAFAKKFGVSRQTVVGDIALMRALGAKIIATPRGYEYQEEPNQAHQAVIVCRHEPDEIEQELTLIINNGGTVVDVSVDHPLYGQLRGQLAIRTHSDIQNFLQQLRHFEGHPLAVLTNGVHLHTITYQTDEQLKNIKNALRVVGILYEPLN